MSPGTLACVKQCAQYSLAATARAMDSRWGPDRRHDVGRVDLDVRRGDLDVGRVDLEVREDRYSEELGEC